MIYKVIIRPSRVEFVLRTFSSDYNKLSDKKLGSKEFSFRFNREIIDTGAYYKSFYRILADLIQPFKKDIKQLQISLRSSFFQVRSIHCEQDMQTDTNYVNWEVDKTINDVSEHFKYGTYYEESIQMLHLFVIRKSVESYFDEILKKIISYDVNFSVGYDFINDSKENVFVSTNIDIVKPFDSDQSSLRMWNFPTEKIRSEVRFKRTLISTIFLFVLLSAFYLTYFQSENMFKLYTDIFPPDTTKETPRANLPLLNDRTSNTPQDTTVTNKTTSSEEKFLEKLFEDDDDITDVKEIIAEPELELKSINIHHALDSLISFKPKSLIYENNIALIQFIDKYSYNKSLKFAENYKLKVITDKKNFLSIQIGKKGTEYLPATEKDHKQICRELKINSKQPYLTISDTNLFNKITDILLEQDLMYNKFVISYRGSKLFIAVYFD